MSLKSHAERELSVYFKSEDEYDSMIKDSVLELIDLFAQQGHSGFSASITRQLFHQLADYKPLGPLTGEQSEWNEVTDNLWQNNRCSHVFREFQPDGTYRNYDGEGIVFKDKNGDYWVNSNSNVEIEFPYTPTHEYRDYIEGGN